VVTNLNEAQQKAFVDATKSLYDTWVPKIGKDIYEKAKTDMAK
jgi:TRAP-type C4-dicarboxylate transport system substrate-binding protein